LKHRTLLIMGAALVAASASYVYWKRGTWETLVDALAPDGFHRAVVRCHRIPTPLADARYHYYLAFEPPIAFRPVSTPSTLKLEASAVKNDHVVFDWATDHYIGYLQGVDDVDGRRPSRIEWAGEKVIVRSEDGIAGEFEMRK
jgi:hypothetical protein